MDVSFSNVLEGTRQYFQGLPKATNGATSVPQDEAGATVAQPFWPAAPHAAEGAIAQSGSPMLADSRPPSVAAVQLATTPVETSVPTLTTPPTNNTPRPPRPPSEGLLEPKPHIIHKATVMQQAQQKQLEEAYLNPAEDLERPPSIHLISPPTHIIRKPSHALPEPGSRDINRSSTQEVAPFPHAADRLANSIAASCANQNYKMPTHLPTPPPHAPTPPHLPTPPNLPTPPYVPTSPHHVPSPHHASLTHHAPSPHHTPSPHHLSVQHQTPPPHQSSSTHHAMSPHHASSPHHALSPHHAVASHYPPVSHQTPVSKLAPTAHLSAAARHTPTSHPGISSQHMSTTHPPLVSSATSIGRPRSEQQQRPPTVAQIQQSRLASNQLSQSKQRTPESNYSQQPRSLQCTSDPYARYAYEAANKERGSSKQSVMTPNTVLSKGTSPYVHHPVRQPTGPQQTYSRLSTPARQAHSTNEEQRLSNIRTNDVYSNHRYSSSVTNSTDNRVPPIIHPSHPSSVKQPSYSQPYSPKSSVPHPYGTSVHPHIQDNYSSSYEYHNVPKKNVVKIEPYSPISTSNRARINPTLIQEPQRLYGDVRLNSLENQHSSSPYNPTVKMSQPNSVSTVHPYHYQTRPPDPNTRQNHNEYQLPHDIGRTMSRSTTYNYPTTNSYSYNNIKSNAKTSNLSYTSQPYQTASVLKTTYESQGKVMHNSPVRNSVVKSGYPVSQQRMTVSVTSLVNEMNNRKQQQTGRQETSNVQHSKIKRESPLDLSVKTVKNSADSTGQDDTEAATYNMHEQHRNHPTTQGLVHPHYSMPISATAVNSTKTLNNSHKVDFSPNFQSPYPVKHNPSTHSVNKPPIYHYNNINEMTEHNHTSKIAYKDSRPPVLDHRYQHKQKMAVSAAEKRVDPALPRIDLTLAMGKDYHRDNKPDPNFVRDNSRKRHPSHVNSNIPEKILRCETWNVDSRLDGSAASRNAAHEQQRLLRQPVYDYTSYKLLENCHNNENKQNASVVHSYQTQNQSHCYSHPYNMVEKDNQNIHNINHPYGVSKPIPAKTILPKATTARDVQNYTGGPADKRVLSILRNSLETKNIPEHHLHNKSIHNISEPIIIDSDGPDIMPEHQTAASGKPNHAYQPQHPHIHHKLQVPKAVDSIRHHSERKYTERSNRSDEFVQHQNNVDVLISADEHVKDKPYDADVAAVLAARIRTKAELKGFILPVLTEKLSLASPSQIKQESIIYDSSEQNVITIRKNIEFNGDENCNKVSEDLNEDRKPVIDISLCKVEKDEENDEKSREQTALSYEELNKDKIYSLEDSLTGQNEIVENDFAWDLACDSFVQQLKSGISKKKAKKRKTDPGVDIKLEQTNPDLVVVRNIKIEDTTRVTLGDVETETLTKVNNIQENVKKCHENKLQEDLKHCSSQQSVINYNKSGSTLLLEKIKEEIVENSIEENDSSDDDEPLIKSKILKEKIDLRERIKKEILMETKPVYVKLEYCDISGEMGKSSDVKISRKSKTLRTSMTSQTDVKKRTETVDQNEKTDISSNESDCDEVSVTRRLRVRKNTSTKVEEDKEVKISVKGSPKKIVEQSEKISLKKPGFGDGSDFQPGWEEELYRYKRSLRMPTRLINVPRNWPRISTSLPDLDPSPVSPSPSSTTTDEIYPRRKYAASGCDPTERSKYIDSDLDSNSSFSVTQKASYDSEASCSTVGSSTSKKGSILDVLIQKCGRKGDPKKKSKEDSNKPKMIPKSSNLVELLPTPVAGLESHSITDINDQNKKEKVSEDTFFLGSLRKKTVSTFNDAFISSTDEAVAADEFSSVVLKSRTRTESKILKQRATIKEVFGDERPASAPPTANQASNDAITKNKTNKKLKKQFYSIREGLRSTRSLKRNDAKGRLLRLKKRNNMLALATKKIKDGSSSSVPKVKKDAEAPGVCQINVSMGEVEQPTSSPNPTSCTKKRLKRLFTRRKFSSGFDYIRKKKKIIKREDDSLKVNRRHFVSKPNPESVHDIQKEIKCWIINKSIGETPLHRAARLGYTDCVAYCLESLDLEPSARDNAGFTPLHVAAARGHLHIARLLLQYGADVSAPAQGGIRPLHEACENEHVEVIRLLLSFGADPVLATYAGQTPASLAEGAAGKLLRQHIGDVQGTSVDPWYFRGPSNFFDPADNGCDIFSCPTPPAASPTPPPTPLEVTAAPLPLPALYRLLPTHSDDAPGFWCLLQEISTILQIKSKESLLKQIHSGPGPTKSSLRELPPQEFLERALCQQLMGAGERVNLRASRVALVRYTSRLQEMLHTQTSIIS